MSKKLIPLSLARKNIKRKVERSGGLIAVSAMLAFVLFSGIILTKNLANGLKSMSGRFGADVMVVPAGFDGDIESILLGGSPKYFYFDKSILEKIRQTRGVESATPQLYLVSSSRGCCAAEVQFIGIDWDSDFVVKPWITKVFPGRIKERDLILGSAVPFNYETKKIIFYGEEYNVAGVLDESASGMDNSVYASMDTIRNMYKTAVKRGLKFKKEMDIENSISSVFVKIGTDRTKDETAFFIERTVGKRSGIQVIATESVIHKAEKQLTNFTAYLKILQFFVFVFAVITMFMIFDVTIRERKMEFATLRAIGAASKFTRSVILSEAFLICTAGAFIGIALSAVAIFPFNVYIGKKLGMPYLSIGVMESFIYIAAVFAVTIIAGLVSSIKSAVNMGRAELYLTMRDEY